MGYNSSKMRQEKNIFIVAPFTQKTYKKLLYEIVKSVVAQKSVVTATATSRRTSRAEFWPAPNCVNV